MANDLPVAPLGRAGARVSAGAFRWICLFVVVVAAPYACRLAVNGLEDLPDAGDRDGSSGGPVGGTDGASGTDDGFAGGFDGGSGAPSCPAGVQDQATPCTSSSPDCEIACGPELATGGSLGSATCSCNASTQVYSCATCTYPTPLPPCYALGGRPPTCPTNARSDASCPKPCDPANPSATPACAFVTNGKVDGCQCILKSGDTKPVWTCAIRW